MECVWLSDDAHDPSRYTHAAGDTPSLLALIARAKARRHLAADATVRSCYETSRDDDLRPGEFKQR
ncbi:hypothetical protein WM15_00130 [Burkholderia ubonensis]|nr:hypothetical protein WM15_00130 [Burkholderia ubonensis]